MAHRNLSRFTGATRGAQPGPMRVCGRGRRACGRQPHQWRRRCLAHAGRPLPPRAPRFKGGLNEKFGFDEARQPFLFLVRLFPVSWILQLLACLWCLVFRRLQHVQYYYYPGHGCRLHLVCKAHHKRDYGTRRCFSSLFVLFFVLRSPCCRPRGSSPPRCTLA